MKCLKNEVVSNFFIGLFGFLVIAGMMSCNRTAQEEEQQTIRLAYANWSEGVAMTHLAAEILENQLEYKVITKMTDIESVFELLASEEYDVFVDAWLPNTHKSYMDQYGENLEDLGINVEEVQTGLMVPAYMEVQSIGDLEGRISRIVGIESGAGIMASAQNAVQAYDLSADLIEGSEKIMMDSLINAVKRREPIVVTGWTPHWVYNRYELKFLEDPMNVFGDPEQIHTIARENFTSEHARASLFFERFKLSEEQLGALMNEFETFPDNERRAVQNWMDDYEFVVNRWIRGLQPEREKVM